MSKLPSFIYILICISSQLFAISPDQAQKLLNIKVFGIVSMYTRQEKSDNKRYKQSRFVLGDVVTFLYKDYLFIPGENNHSVDLILPKYKKEKKNTVTLKDLCFIINKTAFFNQNDKYSVIEELHKETKLPDLDTKKQQDFLVFYMYELAKGLVTKPDVSAICARINDEEDIEVVSEKERKDRRLKYPHVYNQLEEKTETYLRSFGLSHVDSKTWSKPFLESLSDEIKTKMLKDVNNENSSKKLVRELNVLYNNFCKKDCRRYARLADYLAYRAKTK